jgi:voltage-gated potassium channel
MRERASAELAEESSTYELFIGFVTLLAIAVNVFALLIKVPQVEEILFGTDTLICLIFLFDFARSFKRAPDRLAYLFGPRPGRSIPIGIFDLLGSVPGVGWLRLLRLFRLPRVASVLDGRRPRDLLRDFLARRAESAAYVIVVAALLVMLVGSSLIAFVEPPAEGSNIKTGGDAFWWAFVTITTVGYGDRYPVTSIGRFVGILTMSVGIGIFGVLTSFLAQFFLRPDTPLQNTTPTAADDPLPPIVAETAEKVDVTAAELRSLRAEIGELRALIEQRSGTLRT